jgi:low affinity Fe/Cu permease
MRITDRFRKFASWMSDWLGSPWAFLLALASIVIWLVFGPFLHFSDAWQLVMNTATSIITFLMVFLVQSTQNRDAKAIHLKLNELLRAVKNARTELVDLEDLSDDELEALQAQFQRVRDKSRQAAKQHASQNQASQDLTLDKGPDMNVQLDAEKERLEEEVEQNSLEDE